jgi:hypothetical protein
LADRNITARQPFQSHEFPYVIYYAIRLNHSFNLQLASLHVDSSEPIQEFPISRTQWQLGNVSVPNNAVNWSRNSGFFFVLFHHSAFLGLAAQLPLSFGAHTRHPASHVLQSVGGIHAANTGWRPDPSFC